MVMKRLEREVVTAGGRVAWCAKHLVSHSYLSDVLAGRREPGAKILTALGLRKEERFVAIGKETA